MKWNREWIDLQNIEHMIAECWRINERQLEKYCTKLSQQKDLVFAGELGIRFLELICGYIELGKKPDWSKLQKDVRLMQELIQDGQGQHEVYWKSQYQELSADTAAYFGTEFGRVFTEQIAVKLELNLSEEQKMLQHDIRKIQKICASCDWEDEVKARKEISLVIQDEQYYFSSWLGDAFINVLQERYGIKEEDEEEPELGSEPEPEPEIQEEHKAERRLPLKTRAAWTLVICILTGAAIFWLYMMQAEDGQGRFRLQNLITDTEPSGTGLPETAVKSGDQELGSPGPDKLAEKTSDRDTAGQAEETESAGAASQTDSSSETASQAGKSSKMAGQDEISGDGLAGQAVNLETDSEEPSAGPDQDTADTGMADSWKEEEAPDILPQYKAFYQDYPDVFGWLKIPGTEIDHPVMQSDDAQRGEKYYYLHRDYTGRKAEAGSLFVESKSSCFPQDDNTVIYGHNMSNGRNFGILEKYKDKDFFKSHQTIQYDTVYETGTYQIAAVLITRILYQEEEGFRYYQFYNYDTDSEFQECVDFIKENQLYDTGEDLQYGDQLLMLSTCEYSRPNGRLVVVARKSA